MYSLRLKELGAGWITFTTGTQEIFFTAAGVSPTRLAAQFDALYYVSRAYSFDAVVTSYWMDASGAVVATREAPPQRLRIPIVNEHRSPFGLGWSMPGLARLYDQGDGVYITTGDGTGLWFAKNASGKYDAPEGSTLRVERVSNGALNWTLTTLDQQNNSGFDAAGRMISATINHVETRFDYNSDGSLASITDPVGKVTTFGYTGNGALAWIQDPTGRRTSTASSGASVWQFYEPDGQLGLDIDYNGGVLLGYWDRNTKRANGAQARWQYDYDGHGLLGAVTSPQVSFAKDSTTRLVTRYQPLQSVVLPAPGRGSRTNPAPALPSAAVRSTITDHRGNTTRIALDRFGQPTRVEAPLGQTSVIERKTWGPPERMISARGDTTDFGYDQRRDLVTITHRSSGQVDSISYSDDHRVTRIAGGRLTVWNEYESYFDSWGQPIGLGPVIATGAGSGSQYFEWVDGRSRPARIYGPGGHQEFAYGSTGFRNTESITAANGARTTYRYDSFGRPEWVIGAHRDSMRTEYDVLNRPVRVTDPAGGITRYDYSVPGQTVITDPLGQQYTTMHNALGWVTSSTDPRGRTERFDYDRFGNLVTYTNRRGQKISFGYDTFGRVIWRDADSQRTSYNYADDGSWVAASNLESRADTVRTYQPDRTQQGSVFTDQITLRGNRTYVLRTTTDRKGSRTLVQSLDGSGYSVDYGYKTSDESYRLTSIGNLAGGRTTLTYDDAQWLTKVGLANGDTLFSDSRAIRYKRFVLDQALGTSVERDVTHRVVKRHNFSGELSRSFSLNAMGRLTAQADSASETETRCDEDPYNGQEYCWQNSWMVPVSAQAYAYDAVGNRTDRGAAVLTGNRLDRFDGFALTYDDDGNLLSKTGNGLVQTFTWNSLGQLDSVITNGRTATYGYDGWGRRVRKTVEGVTTRYVYDGDHIAMELDAAGTTVLAQYSYYPGVDQPHTMKRLGSVYYFLSDGQNVVGLVDSSGNLVNEYHYTPWGTTESARESVATPFRYAGREYDAESGLYFNRARYYDPVLGRFISEDPIGLAGGINPYAYAGNDPINNTDPSGLCSRVIPGAGKILNFRGEMFGLLIQPDTPCEEEQLAWNAFWQSRWGWGGISDPVDEWTYWHDLEQSRQQAFKIELMRGAVGSITPTPCEVCVGVGRRLAPAVPLLGAATMGVLFAAPLGEAALLFEVGQLIRFGRAGQFARSYQFYEVLFQAEVTGRTRAAHRGIANRALADALKADDVFARGLNRELGHDVLRYMQSGRGALRNPFGTTWHHPADKSGVVQLLWVSEHTEPLLQAILHPGGRGGFSIYRF
jgi:RHS repeat-associated protein